MFPFPWTFFFKQVAFLNSRAENKLITTKEKKLTEISFSLKLISVNYEEKVTFYLKKISRASSR